MSATHRTQGRAPNIQSLRAPNGRKMERWSLHCWLTPVTRADKRRAVRQRSLSYASHKRRSSCACCASIARTRRSLRDLLRSSSQARWRGPRARSGAEPQARHDGQSSSGSSPEVRRTLDVDRVPPHTRGTRTARARRSIGPVACRTHQGRSLHTRRICVRRRC